MLDFKLPLSFVSISVSFFQTLDPENGGYPLEFSSCHIYEPFSSWGNLTPPLPFPLLMYGEKVTALGLSVQVSSWSLTMGWGWLGMRAEFRLGLVLLPHNFPTETCHLFQMMDCLVFVCNGRIVAALTANRQPETIWRLLWSTVVPNADHFEEFRRCPPGTPPMRMPSTRNPAIVGLHQHRPQQMVSTVRTRELSGLQMSTVGVPTVIGGARRCPAERELDR